MAQRRRAGSATANYRDLARRFLEFTLSDAGQKLWLLPQGHPEGPTRHSIERMPVRPGLYTQFRDISNIGPSPFDLPAGFRYDARLAQQRRGVPCSPNRPSSRNINRTVQPCSA